MADSLRRKWQVTGEQTGALSPNPGVMGAGEIPEVSLRAP